MTESIAKGPTRAEQVADILRDEIHLGEIEPGSPLRQNDIAARLGVSSTPVREAFQILERAGLVVREGRRGVRVFRPSVQDLVDAFEVRVTLESTAAGLAAERMSESARERLAQIAANAHLDPLTDAAYLQVNANLHGYVALGSGNPRLAELIESQQAATAAFISFLGVDHTTADVANDEHDAVVRAILARQPVLAAETMRLHLMARLDALRVRLEH